MVFVNHLEDILRYSYYHALLELSYSLGEITNDVLSCNSCYGDVRTDLKSIRKYSE